MSAALPQANVPFIDERTNQVNRAWYEYFRSLGSIVGGVNGVVQVPHGGTGLEEGTPGGILAFTSARRLASSAQLVSNRLVLGGGSGAPTTPLSLGTNIQVLHGNASGAPIFGPIVTADLPDDGVTFAKIEELSANVVLGRGATAGNPEEIPVTAAGRALLDDANAAAQRVTLGLEIGVNVQAYDADLSALAGLATAADKVPYFTGAGTAALADFTAAGRALVNDANAAEQRTTLGLSSSINGVYNIDGTTSGTVDTITITNGLITAITTRP